MGLFDKLTGTKYPGNGVAPRPAEEVRAALLGLNGPDVPYVVRNGIPSEGADLVAEWRIREPAWHAFFARVRLSRTVKTRMRLVPANHEVRALDEQQEVTWVGDTPRLVPSREYARGQVTTVSRDWTIERGADGRLRMTEESRFDTGEMKNPLRDAVLGAGWTWRGAVFKL
ncbi:hypothetical protein I5Q34_16400 [Streptomyces sp. AV19]|uniref:hypothetical protein n=1 Tax=Streptomyces sp. AV19 TaxID=2793068 RepID=UPI0018FEC2DE|nr:hypothetical protein [Streptomyces sp. AV19]MBH1935830.1 hypothetical protein [Streptomyces sp. AV19]MDG4534027.1 hypothetical protein [Streptomyces sp. AV19]